VTPITETGSYNVIGANAAVIINCHNVTNLDVYNLLRDELVRI